MLSVIIDLVLLAILVFFVIGGLKKGLILGISGILSLVIAFYGAGLVASTYSYKFTPMIEPFISGLVDKSVTETRNEYEAEPPATADESELDTIGVGSLVNLGIFKGTAEKIIEELKDSISDVGYNFKTAVVGKLSSAIAYILTFAVVFILIIILFAVVSRLIDFAFRLPGLELVNNVGGTLLGALKGLLVLFAVAWVMRYFGGIFPDETINKTFLLSFLMKNNLLAAFLGI